MDRVDPDEAGLNLRRFYADDVSGDVIELDESAAQHARVLRLGVGDTAELFDGAGRTRAVRIEQVAKGRLRCRALGPVVTVEPGPEVVLVQCLPKGKKLDDIVRMTTELGLSQIQLAVSERCVVQKSQRDEHKVERLARIACEAARQSEQAYVPRITEPASLREVIARAPEQACKLALTERSPGGLSLGLVTHPLWLVVGPEGGLSERDRAILTQGQFREVGLGRSILRTETAAVVGVALGLSALGWGR